MAVYVDQLRTHHHLPRMSQRVWCHMLADSPTELLAMARRIGLPDYAIQNRGTYKEHFDLVPRKRKQAIQSGALEINMRQVAEILKSRRLTDTEG